MKSHFKQKTAPHKVLLVAYLYIAIVSIVLYKEDFYKNNDFFNWGPPVSFFGKKIESEKSFYGLHLLIFFHQLINNCVNSIVYAWLINSVQDPKTKKLEYKKWVALALINLFDIYSEIDVVFIIGGFMSQISFVLTIIIANIITSTYINNKYIEEKNKDESELLNV